MGGFLYRCYDCDYWLARVQTVCPNCQRRYAHPPSEQCIPQEGEELDGYCDAPDLPCPLSPNQEKALAKLRQNSDWEDVFGGLELEDAIEMLWDQFYQIAAPSVQRPEVMDDQAFIIMRQAVGRLNSGLEALKSIFPYNQFELENEKQELINLIHQMDETRHPFS